MTRTTPRLAMTGTAAVIAAMLLVLTGCASQIGGLAPVGGDALTGVRIAAVDVLLERKLEILEVPVCTQVAKAVSCVGSLIDGSVLSPPRPPVRSSKGEALHTYLNRSKASLGVTR